MVWLRETNCDRNRASYSLAYIVLNRDRVLACIAPFGGIVRILYSYDSSTPIDLAIDSCMHALPGRILNRRPRPEVKGPVNVSGDEATFYNETS